jgi:hypothetical protein
LICSSGKIKQWTCKDNQCSYDADTNKVDCPNPGSSTECATTGGNVGDCCVASTYVPSCTNGGANALICSSGKIKEWTCKDNQCSYNSDTNKVDCPNPNSSTDCVTTGGNVGDCCVASTYVPSCTNGGANALICSSGKIKQWTCKDNQCSYNAETNRVDCPNPNN